MANKKTLRVPTSEEAREMQKLSAQKRSENAKERKLLKERILEKAHESDWDEMVSNLIDRAKENDRSFEIVRDTLGEKPKEQFEIGTTDIQITVGDWDK